MQFARKISVGAGVALAAILLALPIAGASLLVDKTQCALGAPSAGPMSRGRRFQMGTAGLRVSQRKGGSSPGERTHQSVRIRCVSIGQAAIPARAQRMVAYEIVMFSDMPDA